MQRTPVSSYDLPPRSLDEAFQRAHAELHAAEAAATAEEAALDAEPDVFGADGERLLIGDELLHKVREPIEWLLSLAHRLAAGDPDEVAAIDRLSAAFHSRLAGRSLGVRLTDALAAFGLLVGALDPQVVVQTATKTIADGVATILTCEGAALAAQLVHLAGAVPVAVHRACVPRRRRHQGARTHHTR